MTKNIAAEIRAQLRVSFPEQKFSVVSERGSATGVVRVRWDNGPLAAEVRPVVSGFASGQFDASDDSFAKRGNGALVIMLHRSIG